MTFFSLVAIAFGMLASGAERAVPRLVSPVAVERAARATRRRAHGGTSIRFERPSRAKIASRFQPLALRRVIAPLRGALTPRAPEPAFS
jgi:hypothetical protein